MNILDKIPERECNELENTVKGTRNALIISMGILCIVTIIIALIME